MEFGAYGKVSEGIKGVPPGNWIGAVQRMETFPGLSDLGRLPLNADSHSAVPPVMITVGML
jgi:hypothetical protein